MKEFEVEDIEPQKLEAKFRKAKCAQVSFPDMTLNAQALWAGAEPAGSEWSRGTMLCPCNRPSFEAIWEGDDWNTSYPEADMSGEDQKTLAEAVKEVIGLAEHYTTGLITLGKPRIGKCEVSDGRINGG